MPTPTRHLLAALAAAALLTACAEAGAVPLPRGSEPAVLDPADFSTTIDNPWWPMTPGTVWRYEEVTEDGAVQQVEVTVTQDTRTVAGIEARVVHDLVTQDGEIVEDTYDWYAQDADCNVWYLGEDTREFSGGEVVSTEGSWEAGVGGAQAGVVMPADPHPGLAYRQEYLAGEAEDEARVLSVDEFAAVPQGSYRDLIMTRDTTPLQPEVLEYKFFARGVGPVLTIDAAGGGREELVELAQG